MNRNQFLKALGFGAGSFYTTAMLSCNKSDQTVTPGNTASTSNSRTISVKLNDDHVVDGYTDKLSYLPGEVINVYINASDSLSALIGLYDAKKALKEYVSATISTQQPGQEAFKNGYQYQPSFQYSIPADFKSGLYYWAGKIPFIVKNPNKSANIVVVLPTNTDNAYNDAGGLSSYTTPLSPILSFQRPYKFQHFSSSFWPWATTINYLIDYITDQDLDDYSNFSYAKLLIIPGHNEYWTRTARLNFDTFVDKGNHALILSGNTMWWQVRYSADGNQMICYKSHNDPISDHQLKTINWFESSLNYPIQKSLGVSFELGGYGNQGNGGWNGFKIVSENSPLLASTNLKNNNILSCSTTEYDGAAVKYESGNPHPVLDNKLNFFKMELIGYDYGFRLVKTVGTFTVLQRTSTSGIIVNPASTDWCSVNGIGGQDGKKIKQITLNAINLLLNDHNVFSL